MMKRITALSAALALALSLTACGGPAAPSSQSEDPAPGSQGETVRVFGDTVTTEDDLFTFTPTFGGFAPEVGNWPDENYLTPDGTAVGSNPFKAEEEKTIMWFSADVEYIGDSTENETFSYAFTVVYDGDYEFASDPYNCSYTEDPAGGEWDQGSDSTTMTFEPLSSKTTRLARLCIEVPQQLETDTAAPLQVIFTLNGAEYAYQIR